MARRPGRAAFAATIAAAALVLLPRVPHAAGQGGPAPAPRLLVVLVVDQLRTDYLETFRHQWQRGFRRLLDDGAFFERAEFPHLNTVTCAGHTTIATGTLPRTHGMVLNSWWHRDAQRTLNCMEDDESPHVSYGRPAKSGNSPKRMLVNTLGDELRAASADSRVVTLSLKPRSAIGLAGRGGVVTWFDAGAHAFVTSRWFAKAPVPEVARFISRHPIEADLGRTWSLARDAGTYRYADDRLGERPTAGWDRTFPHEIRGQDGADARFYEAWEQSPLSDAYLGRMAESLLDAFDLGRRGAVDFLGVSFSALDLVGHDYGPRSREVEDLLVRLDGTIGALLDRLDERVGRGRYLLALSADHGVSPVPEQEQQQHRRGGRVVIDAVRKRIEDALVRHLGKPAPVNGRPGRYVEAMNYVYVYLAPGVLETLERQPAVMRAVERAVLGHPGVARVLRSDQLSTTSNDPLVRAAAFSHMPERSGDLIVIPREYWYMATSHDASGATHGTSYEYDRRVPVILFGAGVKPGRYADPATPADIAPTLADAIGRKMRQAEGRSLRQFWGAAAGR